MVTLLKEASEAGASLVVFPELALTTFFPRYFMEDPREVESYFEREMPNPAVAPLFDEAKKRACGFYLGYAELVEEGGRTRRFNTSILVGTDGSVVGKYRKIHLPGHADRRPEAPFQHLEKRYFEVGDLGFPSGAPSGGSWGCASATTAVGPKPSG